MLDARRDRSCLGLHRLLGDSDAKSSNGLVCKRDAFLLSDSEVPALRRKPHSALLCITPTADEELLFSKDREEFLESLENVEGLSGEAEESALLKLVVVRLKDPNNVSLGLAPCACDDKTLPKPSL